MKMFDWNDEKNDRLKEERGISFEDILYYMNEGGILDIVSHPLQVKYPGQKMFIVAIENYAYLVPFIETENSVFLKTIIPSRKATKKYLKG
ncbi:MAG: BrnT family toxin [Elusimicrobia bacterium]|nr:BrnT family toxin [Elusimicrobiota bacterium]